MNFSKQNNKLKQFIKTILILSLLVGDQKGLSMNNLNTIRVFGSNWGIKNLIKNF